jgi:hypothetical protein
MTNEVTPSSVYSFWGALLDLRHASYPPGKEEADVTAWASPHVTSESVHLRKVTVDIDFEDEDDEDEED